jgi:hypothetical protein
MPTRLAWLDGAGPARRPSTTPVSCRPISGGGQSNGSGIRASASGRGAGDCRSNALHRVVDRLVLPDPKDCPPGSSKRGRLLLITLPGPPDLRLPELAVRGGHLSVLRATMPEAAIHEHSDLPPREDDVGSQPLARDVDAEILPESQACSMQRRSKRDFRTRIATRVGLHRRRRVRARGRRDQTTWDHGSANVAPCQLWRSLPSDRSDPVLDRVPTSGPRKLPRCCRAA